MRNLLLFGLYFTCVVYYRVSCEHQALIDVCGHVLQLHEDDILNITLQHKLADPDHIVCTVEVVFPDHLIGIEVTHMVMGMERDMVDTEEGEFTDYVPRGGIGIHLNDSDTTPLLSPDYLYYSNMRQTVSFDSRIACLKYGMGDAPCTVEGRNYYPPWGSVVDRKFISSGTQVSLQYVGRPIDDYFEIIFTPIITTGCDASCPEACAATNLTDCRCTDGSFTGEDCTTDVDECDAYDACSHYLQRCENSVGGFECQCRVGYERDVDDVNENEDFTECIDIDECTRDKGVDEDANQIILDPCIYKDNITNSTCINIPGGYDCGCLEGYRKMEGICIEDCVSTLLDCGVGSCVYDETLAKVQCECPEGYTGRYCEESCGAFNCQNNGTCIIENDKAKCDCLDGYSGENCEKAKHICDWWEDESCTDMDYSPEEVRANCGRCKNNGYCYRNEESSLMFSCSCKDGFIGRTCSLVYGSGSSTISYTLFTSITTFTVLCSILI